MPGSHRDLLVVLNPRKIEECLAAFDALPIDRLWIRNMSEYQIQEAWPQVMAEATGYDRLILASDDGIPRPHALRLVLDALDAGHPVATAYSNLSSTDFRVNLTKQPTKDAPSEDAYDLWHFNEVQAHRDPLVPTYFTGMCLTGMSRELWVKYPFQTFWDEPPGSCSDFVLSKRLVNAGVPIVACRDAFVFHVKETWNQADREVRKRLYIGLEPAAIELEVFA